jgi:hypothetical protein
MPALGVLLSDNLMVLSDKCKSIGRDQATDRGLHSLYGSATLGAMDRREAIARLKEHEAELRQLGVEHLYMFGSTARGAAPADSDVDLFFDHPEGSIGLYELMDLKDAAARILGCEADIMTRRSLHRVLRQGIEASALQIF